jgi:hypothetical protein
MKTIEQLEQQLDRMERILLSIVPFRRLPLDLQRHAAEVQGVVAPVPTNDRARVAMAEFEKMCVMDRFKRKPAKWPEALIQSEVDFFTNGENTLPVVPLSSLTNRCAARSAFKVGPGEVSARLNAEATIKEIGLIICSLSDAGLERKNQTRVVHRAGWKMEHVEHVIEEPEDEPEEVKPDPMAWATKLVAEKRAAAGHREIDEDDVGEEDEVPKPKKKQRPAVWGGFTVEEPSPSRIKSSSLAGYLEEEDGIEEEKPPTLAERMKAQHEKEVADGTYAAHVGSFEESDCAQGVGRFNPRDEPDESGDIPDLEEDDDLIEDDDDWGPDEVDTHNPVKEQFEREAAEAAAREEEAERLMSTGDYYLKNGVVTRKAGR